MRTIDLKRFLKVSDCDVMHLREAGKIQFKKKGNAYWYLRSDVEELMAQKNSQL